MRKIFAQAGLTLCLAVAFCLTPAMAQEKRILATTFPIWLITLNVTQGVPGVSLDLMIPAATGCPHDYALTPQAMLKLEHADILVMNGLGLDGFIRADNLKPHVSVLDSSAAVPDLLESGHNHDDSDAAEGSGHEDHEDHEHSAFNPHLFASPRRAAGLATAIGDGLAGFDPAHADMYLRNAAAYAASLNALADDFSALGARVSHNRIVAQHSVFDYLARDMGLDVVAVIQAREGQAPSAAAMLCLIREIREKNVRAIFTEPQYSDRAGKILAAETGIPLAVLDPVASGPLDHGPGSAVPLDYYQAVMRANLRTLEQTLAVR